MQKLIVLGALVFCMSSMASGAETPVTRRYTPSPEAYKACEGKRDGDAAKFVNARGMTVSGTCVQVGDKLALHPDRHKKPSNKVSPRYEIPAR